MYFGLDNFDFVFIIFWVVVLYMVLENGFAIYWYVLTYDMVY